VTRLLLIYPLLGFGDAMQYNELHWPRVEQFDQHVAICENKVRSF